MRYKLLLVISSLIFSSFAMSTPLPMATPASQGFNPKSVQAIDQFFTDEIALNRMPGGVIAVAKNGKLIMYKAYGYRDKKNNQAMTLDTVFNLASMTKVMAAAGAMTFFEEGKLQLSAPVSQWFPEFKTMTVGKVENGVLTRVPTNKPITVQDLLRHTNGLTYGARANTPVHQASLRSSAEAAAEFTGPEFIERLANTPLLYEPGTAWDYSFGIDVVGLLQEKIAGKRLNDILQERIWSRIGMKDTGFTLNDSTKSRLAQPLDIDPITGKKQKIGIYQNPPKFDCGGSCAYSTAADYIRFGQMLLNGGSLDGQRILGPQTVAFMTSDHLGHQIKNNVGQTEPGRDGYGFGLGVAVRKEKGLSATNGNIGDYTWNGANGTLFWVDPKEKLVVVMMAAAPGELRKEYRERINALIYAGLNH
jgi:CubicO group peptidase (beta-lactamase class C family)